MLETGHGVGWGLELTQRDLGFPGGASGARIRLPVQETQETWVRALAQEDPLEKEMATRSPTGYSP